MQTSADVSLLHYRPLAKAELDTVLSLDLEPDQVERFLGPLDDIVTSARRGPAHAMVALEAAGAMVGFYVVHPAPRDGASWWLGWLAVDRRSQGMGYGVQALRHAIARLQTIPACRRVRLLVAVDNLRARRLYHREGFRPIDRVVTENELVLELALPSIVTSGQLKRANLVAAAVRARRVFRHRRLRLLGGPHPAWVIGVERGPPAPGFTARIN